MTKHILLWASFVGLFVATTACSSGTGGGSGGAGGGTTSSSSSSTSTSTSTSSSSTSTSAGGCVQNDAVATQCAADGKPPVGYKCIAEQAGGDCVPGKEADTYCCPTAGGAGGAGGGGS